MGAESIVNRNGWRMLEFCMDNNLLIGNTFYQHKITFESTTGEVRSAVNYFTYKRPAKYTIMDIRVFSFMELNTEHRLLTMETRFKAPKKGKGVT
jgi:hypothetical protein